MIINCGYWEGTTSKNGFQNDVWTSDDGGVTWEEIIPEGSFY